MTGIFIDPNVADPRARAAFEQIMKQSEDKFTRLENMYKELLATVQKVDDRLKKLE